MDIDDEYNSGDEFANDNLPHTLETERRDKEDWGYNSGDELA